MEAKDTVGHITPAGANIFEDLGFEPEVAARLLAEADAEIAAAKARETGEAAASMG